MTRTIALLGAIAALSLALQPTAAHADMSACGSAYTSKDPQKQIELYTLCLKHGGLVSTDIAGAFNNRGVAYEALGQIDNARQDFAQAVKYDPGWVQFRLNLASTEAQQGKCAEALADLKVALKLAPHRKEVLELKDRLAERCPAPANPPG